MEASIEGLLLFMRNESSFEIGKSFDNASTLAKEAKAARAQCYLDAEQRVTSAEAA